MEEGALGRLKPWKRGMARLEPWEGGVTGNKQWKKGCSVRLEQNLKNLSKNLKFPRFARNFEIV